MIKLPEHISSPQDLTALILEVREYARWYEHETIRRRSGTTSPSTQPVLSPTTATLLRAISGGISLQPKQLEEVIATLLQYKKTSPVITLTLAAPVTAAVKATLTAWCRQELSPNVLVSFESNRTLLGGMVVRYGSHVHDWSHRRALLSSTVSMSEVLNHV